MKNTLCVCARLLSAFIFDPDDGDQIITDARCDISYDNNIDIKHN